MIAIYEDSMQDNELPPAIGNERYIYIILLRYPDLFSKIFRIFTRCEYNHVSIGVSESNGSFYSFVTKGFRKELPLQHPTFKQHEVPCKLYRLKITDEVHHVMRLTLEEHEKKAHKLKYNYFGLLLCLLRIVWPMKNQYFCSQFVSEVLGEVGTVPLEKHSNLYLPDDFTKMRELELCYSGFLSQLVRPKILSTHTPCLSA